MDDQHVSSPSVRMEMSWQEFADLFEDNPIQRDTERRALHSPHLDVLVATHLLLQGAELTDGTKRLYKLDGHTRCFRWGREPSLAPKVPVAVIVYQCQTMAEVEALYKTIDNQVATEVSRDKVDGAFRKLGWMPLSPYLRRGQLKSALGLATSKTGLGVMRTSEYDLIPMWADELRMIDGLHPTRTWFNAGVLAAAVITLRKYRQKAWDFWDLYNGEGGHRTPSQMDGIEALRWYMNGINSHDKKSHVHQDVIMGKAISCFEKWRTEGHYRPTANGSANIRATEVGDYLPKPRPVRPVAAPVELRKQRRA